MNIFYADSIALVGFQLFLSFNPSKKEIRKSNQFGSVFDDVKLQIDKHLVQAVGISYQIRNDFDFLGIPTLQLLIFEYY